MRLEKLLQPDAPAIRDYDVIRDSFERKIEALIRLSERTMAEYLAKKPSRISEAQKEGESAPKRFLVRHWSHQMENIRIVIRPTQIPKAKVT